MRTANDPLPQDRGATGTWQKLLKLRTIASVMHTTAHPDDEHGGLLAMLSRGEGARVSLLTLNRGEAGDNAIGPELFDPLGLIRTEELLRADQYYGVDAQYFTTVIDYGFSKRLEEALVKWGRENVLRDVVRVIRMERPLVVIARFQGNDRDGHGNHQTAGLITQEAYKAAGDPAVFPEQLREGLRPWQPLKLYMGGVRENEDWTLRVDPAVYSPWLGDSYANFARTGLSFQRSQNGGRNDPQPGPAYGYYKRLASQVTAGAKETSVFDGIDTSITGLFATLKHTAPANAPALLGAIQREVDAAIQAFRMDNPSATVPALARGLAAARDASRQLSADRDAAQILKIKEQQFTDAINTALGIDFSAIAQPAGAAEPTGPGAAFAPPPTMDPVVPGQTFDVKLRITNRGSVDVDVTLPIWSTVMRPASSPASTDARPTLKRDQTLTHTLRMTVPATAVFSRPYFSRPSIVESRYSIQDGAPPHRPASMPAFLAHLQVQRRGCAGGHPRAGDPAGSAAALRLCDARARRRAGARRHGLAAAGDRAAGGGGQEPSAPGGAHEQRALGEQRATGAEAAGGMEGRPGLDSVFVHAARREIAPPVPRGRPGDREPRVHGRRGGDRRRPRLSRGLRHRRAPRPRDALPVSRRDQPGPRRRREDRAGAEGRLHHGGRRRGAGGDRAARSAGATADRAGSGRGRTESVRRDHDRHARLRRARRSADLQPALCSTTSRTAAT